ncbi:MAG: Wzz/FepE/Etk N-terminal domain-containing protein [Bacteroidota bacterium]
METPGFADDQQQAARRDAAAVSALWGIVGYLFGQRRFIIVATGIVAVAAVIISLLLPKWYQSSTSVLLPNGGSAGTLSSMLNDLAPLASTLLGGGGGGDYLRFRAILDSRTLKDEVIETFDLVRVYDMEEAEFPMASTRELLSENVSFEIDNEYEHLIISVLDRDPNRAAEMANYFVGALNRRNNALQAQNARRYREYMEQTYLQTLSDMDSSRVALQAFQETYGVIDLPTQAQAFIEYMGTLRAAELQVEIQAEALQTQLGNQNANVQAAQAVVDAARRKSQAALSGREAMMPIARDQLPAVGRQYAELYQEVLVQAEIHTFIRPLYEQARFDEVREQTAVQVLDPAVPPDRKAKPKRSILVILATFSGFALVILYLLARWWTIYQYPQVKAHIQARA